MDFDRKAKEPFKTRLGRDKEKPNSPFSKGDLGDFYGRIGEDTEGLGRKKDSLRKKFFRDKH